MFKVGNYVVEEPVINILYDIRSELKGAKLSSIEVRPTEIKVTCPISSHKNGQESNPSAVIYLRPSEVSWYCFTDAHHGNFIDFVAQCFDCSYQDASNWLIDRYGTLVTSIIEEDDLKLPDSEHHPTYVDESILKGFQDYHPYMDTRHLTPEAVKALEIKYDPITDCLVFPCRDPQGNLVAFTRRKVKGHEFIIDKDFDKSNIWQLHKVLKEKCNTVYICESQINCATLWGWGYPAVALFGASVPYKQIAALNKTGIVNFILAMDPDAAGYKGAKKLIEGLDANKFVDVIVWPENDPRDVNDYTKEEFDKLQTIDRFDI